MTSKCPDGIVHRVGLEDPRHWTIAICGARLHAHDGTEDDVVTCLRCADGLAYRCMHADRAIVRNCPYSYAVKNDPNERCKCCDACAHECSRDV